jgi:CxxC motif-containing protein (DUF1111 family)
VYMIRRIRAVARIGQLILALSLVLTLHAQTSTAVRGGAPGAGGPISGLTTKEGKFYNSGLAAFQEVDTVLSGLGPRFNLNSCAGCHAAPAIGGSSPASNPQVTGNVTATSQVTTLTNLGLISVNGPVREIRFRSDGGVHDLFTIVGLAGAPSNCNITQPPFNQHLSEIIFRIPTPTFGAGLIEAIPDAKILANVGVSKGFGITGHENRNGNDGTLTRFGWKAQNKSLVIFAGEAYNVEQGISNEAFPDERGEGGKPDSTDCLTVPTASDHTNYERTQPQTVSSDVIQFANFMRFLAPPTPSCTVNVNCSASANKGSALFDSSGCSVCHIRQLQTGNHATAALRSQPVNLFSDLLVHNMGKLGDGIAQGAAGPNEFRSAPLWGVGQRNFFLHDGRTNDLFSAIKMHACAVIGSLTALDCSPTNMSGEAVQVITNFNSLNVAQQQAILDFLRTL